MENKSIIEEISKITKKKEKYPYLKNQIAEQKNLILNILKSTGFYFADINVQIKNNNNNSVDIIYNFNLGDRAKIKKIKFLGNKIFKNSKLRNIIISEESKPWKFLTRNKYLDPIRIKLDIERLENFYKNKGYYDVQIKSSFAKLIDELNFELIFNIYSGKKYYFNNITLTLNDEYSDESFSYIYEKFKDLKGKKYSIKSVNNILDEIDKLALRNEFVFANSKYKESIIDDDKIDINISVEESDKLYIERVNIFGNFITEEKVIRNSLIVDEGDPYNPILLNKSINEIKSRNIFKSITTKTIDSDNINNKIVNITVEEKATGEIFAGAGTGTTGSTVSAGIKENNYLGKGIRLDTNLTLSDDEIKGKFAVVNPNFRNSDKSLNTTIESTSSDYLTISGYKTTRTGFTLGTGFEQFDDLFINLNLLNYYEKLETSSAASAIKKKQEGDYIENLINYSITLNKLDQNFQPTEGFRSQFSQSLPLYSDDLSIENSLKLSKYHSINDDLILSAKFFAKAVNSIDDDVRVSKRVYIPSRRLRGFSNIGPKDGTQFIGGNYGTALNLNTTLPNLIYGYENIDFNLFLDAANLWEVDYDSSLDSNKIRSSTGIAVNWFTPIGPLTFSYSVPLSEAKTDKTESFRFRIGTSF